MFSFGKDFQNYKKNKTYKLVHVLSKHWKQSKWWNSFLKNLRLRDPHTIWTSLMTRLEDLWNLARPLVFEESFATPKKHFILLTKKEFTLSSELVFSKIYLTPYHRSRIDEGFGGKRALGFLLKCELCQKRSKFRMQFCLRGSNNVLHVFSLKFVSFLRYYVCEKNTFI